MADKRYPQFEEDQNFGICCEPMAEVAFASEEVSIPDDVPYAHIMDGVLQITPDIEEEINEVERGETVSLSEFKTMFSKWLV